MKRKLQIYLSKLTKTISEFIGRNLILLVITLSSLYLINVVKNGKRK